ncbi:MAG: hypothetical protein GC147_13795 [Porphyrobacter sp.]|nr:hypothetical protein [Porphyrobacter sp.]
MSLFLSLAAVLLGSSGAADDRIAKVSIEHSGTGRLGKLLAYELRQEIAGSRTAALGTDADEGWKIVLLTLEDSDSTTYSATLVRKNFDREFDSYVTSTIGPCPGTALPGCAREIAAGFAGPIADYESGWRETAVVPETGRASR